MRDLIEETTRSGKRLNPLLSEAVFSIYRLRSGEYSAPDCLNPLLSEAVFSMRGQHVVGVLPLALS